MVIRKLIEKHHRASADGARDIAAVQRAFGNERGEKAYEELAREYDAKAAKWSRKGKR